MNKLVKKTLIISSFLFLFIIILNGLGNNSIKEINILFFFIISIFCINGILREFSKHSFSIIIMHWIFILIFFVIAPVIQISYGYFPLHTYLFEEEITLIQFEIIIWIIFYNIGIYISNNNVKIENNRIKKNKEISINKFALVLMTILSIISTIIIIKNTGITALFSRSTSYLSYDGENSQMKSLIIKNFTKVTIVFATIISYIYLTKRKKGLSFFIINFVLLLITCFPTGLSRNAAGIIYLGLFIIIYFNNFKKIKNSVKYIMLFLLAFTIIFPAINVFRNNTLEKINIETTIIETTKNISENHLSGDYDAFVMIENVNRYVKTYGVTYGKQIIGNLLFFIPRNIWNEKPVGSGSMVLEKLGYKFTNVSCPLISEWYINFGYSGIIIGAILFGIICSIIDNKYWFYMNKENSEIKLITLLYPFLVPSFFFMMRGDFLSTFAYTFAYIFLFLVYYQVLKIKIKF